MIDAPHNSLLRERVAELEAKVEKLTLSRDRHQKNAAEFRAELKRVSV